MAVVERGKFSQESHNPTHGEDTGHYAGDPKLAFRVRAGMEEILKPFRTMWAVVQKGRQHEVAGSGT